MRSKYRHLFQFCYIEIFSTNQHGNLVLLDNPGRVRSQIIIVVCQIQRFDIDCILEVTRKSNNTDIAGLRFKTSIYILNLVQLCIRCVHACSNVCVCVHK